MKKQAKRLVLSRETLRELGSLSHARGGHPDDSEPKSEVCPSQGPFNCEPVDVAL
jgi:hypothetical protein